jgi:1-acyl-sn-glycerol-3-phosphate acyltransferase
VIRIWARAILFVAGAKLEVEGHDNLDPDQPYVFMANHLSTFDIPATALILPGTVRFIAKKELFKIPLFSHGMSAVGMIKIDRGNSEEARKTINEAVEILRKGVSIIIFPEGTRSRTGEIQPFKKGGFILAMNSQIPIVPVSISGSQYVQRKKSLVLVRGNIKIRILPPVNTAGLKLEDRNTLVQDVRNRIIDAYDPEFNKP